MHMRDALKPMGTHDPPAGIHCAERLGSDHLMHRLVSISVYRRSEAHRHRGITQRLWEAPRKENAGPTRQASVLAATLNR